MSDIAAEDLTSPAPESTRCLAEPRRQGLRTLQTFDLGYGVWLTDLAIAQDGHVVVLMHYIPDSIVFGELRADHGAAVAKLSRKDGAVLWRQFLDRASSGYPTRLAVIPGSDVVVAGTLIDLQSNRHELLRLRDSDGAVVARGQADLGSTGVIQGLAVSPSGEVLLTAGAHAAAGDRGIPGFPATKRSFFAALSKLSAQLVSQWTFAGVATGWAALGGEVAFDPGGDVLFASYGANPYTPNLGSSNDTFLGRTSPTGTVRWQQRLRYAPLQRDRATLNIRLDVNASGQILLGTDTYEGSTLSIGARDFLLGGRLWLAMMEGQEVRWLRSACSGDSALLDLRATAGGGAVLGGAFAGQLDLGGGGKLGGTESGNVFVASYGAGGAVLAATRLTGGTLPLRGVNDLYSVSSNRGLALAADVNDEVVVGCSCFGSTSAPETRLLRLAPDGILAGP